jgi:hypothetical protein
MSWRESHVPSESRSNSLNDSPAPASRACKLIRPIIVIVFVILDSIVPLSLFNRWAFYDEWCAPPFKVIGGTNHCFQMTSNWVGLTFFGTSPIYVHTLYIRFS